jgi:hypothetical protein
MPASKEIREILEYLEGRKDCAVFGGFAQFAHVSVKYSPDVDVYVKSLKLLNKITKEFVGKGWKNYERAKNEREVWSRLEKKGTNFDIAYSKRALKFFFDDSIAIKVHGYKIYFISKEALFLSKMRLLLSKERTSEKRKRDLEAVIRLQKKIDKKKTVELASKLSRGK